MSLTSIRRYVGVEEGQELPAYAWPGGYPIHYYTQDGGQLCANCANMAIEEGLTGDSDDPQWNLDTADVYYEGPTIQCDHCNADMESAYGDPENEEVTE